MKNYIYVKFNKQNIDKMVLTNDYINIQYKDLEQNFYNEWYELNGDELLSCEPERGDYNMSLQITTMSDKGVYDIILSILNETGQ